MPILCSVVARGTTVLARNVACQGNFEEVTQKVLEIIPPQNDKLTYTQGPYLFHYICEDNIIYLCITDKDFQKSRAFLFLTEIKRRFLALYGDETQTVTQASVDKYFETVLGNEMRYYRESNHDIDVISKVHGELDELKDIMVQNIDSVAARGERLELLVNKTDRLTDNSVTFRITSRNLARSLFWKNVKIYVVIGVIAIIVIYVFVSISCGGMAWPNCVGK
ncbi:vesicle-associated membrane protein 7 [Augochlora pura]